MKRTIIELCVYFISGAAMLFLTMLILRLFDWHEDLSFHELLYILLTLGIAVAFAEAVVRRMK